MSNSFRTVVYFLGAALVLCVVGVIVLSVTDHALPDLLKEIAVGALAGLSGLLVHPGDGAAQPVTVMNSPAAPVPTADITAAPGGTYTLNDGSEGAEL